MSYHAIIYVSFSPLLITAIIDELTFNKNYKHPTQCHACTFDLIYITWYD